MGEMKSQVNTIADDPQFLEMFNDGVSRQELARYYDCQPDTICQVYELLGLTGASDKDSAPSPEEDALSMASLALAPSIAAKAKVAREIWLQKLREESLLATQKRVQEWRAKQL